MRAGRLCLVASVVLVAGCAGGRPVAPVEERRPAAAESSPAGAPLVGRGRTLEQLTVALDAAQARGGGNPAGWLALLAFALLVAEWFLHRTGRMP